MGLMVQCLFAKILGEFALKPPKKMLQFTTFYQNYSLLWKQQNNPQS